MHELPITERILNVVLKHASRAAVKKVVAIHLRIGELSDLEDEWIQRYFDYLSKGTLAENAKLLIERSPIVLRCHSCEHTFQIEKHEMGDLACPECGESRCGLVSGREYYVKDMEVL